MAAKKHEKNLNTSSVNTPRKEKDDGGLKKNGREREIFFLVDAFFDIFAFLVCDLRTFNLGKVTFILTSCVSPTLFFF